MNFPGSKCYISSNQGYRRSSTSQSSRDFSEFLGQVHFPHYHIFTCSVRSPGHLLLLPGDNVVNLIIIIYMDSPADRRRRHRIIDWGRRMSVSVLSTGLRVVFLVVSE